MESPFAALRLRTNAAKRYKQIARTISVIGRWLWVAEQRFRRLIDGYWRRTSMPSGDRTPRLLESYKGFGESGSITVKGTSENVNPHFRGIEDAAGQRRVLPYVIGTAITSAPAEV